MFYIKSLIVITQPFFCKFESEIPIVLYYSNDLPAHRLPSGSWRAQVSINGNRISHTDKTRAKVQSWLRNTLNEIDRGFSFDSKEITLQDYLILWLSNIKDSVRPTTWYQYELTTRKYIIPKMGNINFIYLTLVMIQKLYRDETISGTVLRHRAKNHKNDSCCYI